MRNLKKFLALVLSLIMAAGTISTFASAAKFADVSASDETLTKAVDLLSSVGITTGTTATTFGTSENVTRQQMATFIYRLMKAGKTVEGGDNVTSFTDLDDPFYYFMISWANDMGIIKGRSATVFDPKGKIILQDAYVMLVRALGYEAKEALDYPFGYISIAEEIGLDDGLPSNVKYDTALTRGNVAVLLYNAFYADMATGTTGYEIEYEEVEITGGKHAIVEKGMTPYIDYDTVAKNIFGVKKTVQRIVATPNYCIDEFEKTDDSRNDTEMVTLECFDEEYIDTDNNLFSDVEFASLGLTGKADDYFLIDLSIYYTQESGKEPEILTTSALGSRKKGVPGGKVSFAVNSGTEYKDYMITAGGSAGNYTANQSKEQRFKKYTGKVTVDGVSSYLFNAPWTYSKPADVKDKDKDCITLVWLDATDRDPEDEEYVPDFNFKSDRDVTGRGAEYYAGQTRTEYHDKNKIETIRLGTQDLRGVGLYTSWGFYVSNIIDTHMGNNFEVDVWDSNGDGKIDYMWMKPYTVGVVVEDDGETFMDMHNTANVMDKYGCIYASGKVPSVYTYGAYKEGGEFKDGQVFIGYINGPANYVKCASVAELKYETQTFTGRKGSDSNNIALNGSYRGIWGGSLRYIGFPDSNGSRPGANISGAQLTSSGPFQGKYFKDANIGKDFKIAFVSGLIFHAEEAVSQLGTGSNYAIIFPNTNGSYAYTTSVGVVTDGNLQKSGNYLEAMIDGELTNVIVKPQLSESVEKNNMETVSGEKISLMPLTPKQKNGVYNFSAYVGKLLTYTKNADDEYVFKIAPLNSNTDDSVLATDDEDQYYTYQSDSYGKVTSAFVHSRNNLYQFVKKGTSELHTVVAPSRFVSVTDNTKILIKTYEDDEDVFTYYDSENLPKFSNDVDFKNIKYIVRNNPNSTTIEELVYLYAEAVQGQVMDEVGNTLDYRFVHATKAIKDDDEVTIYYDVYNPFTGKIEEEYETYNEDANVQINGIYSLTANGYINDGALLGRIDTEGKIALDNTNLKTDDLGLVRIEDFDADNGLLAIEGYDILFKVTDDTIVSFIDLDEETIALKNTSILNSTSKAYRCNDDKNMPLLAFVASTEIKNEDDMEEVALVVVVRYNSLADAK